MADAKTPTTPNDVQFANTDIISRYVYVNTGDKTLIPAPDSSAVVGGSVAPMVPFNTKNLSEGANSRAGLPSNAVGVYSAFPSMSPKYVHHDGVRAANMGGLARMYIPVDNPEYLKNLLSRFKKKSDKQVAAVAEQLFGLKATGGATVGAGYIDFILTNVSHSLQEKFQISEVLEDNYVAFFFGQRAPLWTFSGALMNTYQDDWTMNMWRLYAEMGRGSQLAKMGLLLYIRYDSVIIGGGMVGFNWELNSTNELYTPFSFQFLVKTMTTIRGSKILPTKMPEMWNEFYNPAMNIRDETYISLRPTISSSEQDLAVSAQAPGSSDTVSSTEMIRDIMESSENVKTKAEIARMSADDRWSYSQGEFSKSYAAENPSLSVDDYAKDQYSKTSDLF